MANPTRKHPRPRPRSHPTPTDSRIHHIHIRIPERDADLPDLVRRAAESTKSSVSDWVRRALRKETTRQEAKMPNPATISDYEGRKV